jgi:glycosyltransferase involved in cell wall biosynthesis
MFDAEFFPFAKGKKIQSAKELLSLLKTGKFDIFVMEGTGFAGGLAAMLGCLLWKVNYVVSSGDAIAPFLSARQPLGYSVFWFYEKLLCRLCHGFIGWTPYLVGRALALGAPRGMTIPGWPPMNINLSLGKRERQHIRRQLGIPEDAIVVGLVGSLNWSKRYDYCYGAELVRARRMAEGQAHVLVVGGGSGLDELRKLAGDQLGKTIHLTGRVAREEVTAYLAAMDIGAIPQSVNSVGNYRYTTKLMEYKAAHLPVITNQIPMAYDMDDGSLFRLEGKSPWDPLFIAALARLMKNVTQAQIQEKTAKATLLPEFNQGLQISRMTAFIHEIVEAK